MMAPLVAVLALTLLPAGAQADSTPLGLNCSPQDGVRFCQGAKVKTFDGVPLDVDIALPASGDSNLALVVIMHGYAGKKTGLGEMKPWAQDGYAVLDYTARGFGDSCGSASSRSADPAGCAQGWVHLADTRFEVRDTQLLAGMLADEGTVDPQKIGATGGSYGGGQSMALAALRDRQMNPDGSLAPWKSPAGKAMRIAAAAPIVPWTDLAYALTPNGRTLDYTITGATTDLNPVGVEKQSFVSGLYAAGSVSGYYSPVGVDPGADLTQWFALTNSGEPYNSNAPAVAAIGEIAKHHSSYYIPDTEAPAPLFISNGWTDDLFPADEALRFYNRMRAKYPSTAVKLMFFDFGHMRGQGKAPDQARLRTAITAWFAHYLKGTGPKPASDVTALTTTCPKTAPSAGPFSAPTWDAIHPGEVAKRFSGNQTISSSASDPSVSQAVDPIVGPGACAQTSSADISGAATYRLDKVSGSGFTLLGSPLVSGKFAVTGATPVDSQIAARLWDVAPGGQQTLVARGLYRPVGSGAEAFQLHADGWKFAAGHQPKLELLGQDSPYARASNGSFTIAASDVELRLPVANEPGSAPAVGTPSVLPLPKGAKLAPSVVRLTVKLRYRKPRRARACWNSVGVTVGGQGLANLRRVDFLVGKRRVKRDAKRAFTATITRAATRKAHSRALKLKALRKDGRTITVTKRLKAC
jgi:X-Pro dipeptidyl-peptidase (S15 family)